MTSVAFAALALVSLSVGGAAAGGRRLVWTGIDNDQQFENELNWLPAFRPGANDTLVIDSHNAGAADAVIVVINGPFTVAAIELGHSSTRQARIRLMTPLTVTGALKGGPNGHLELSSSEAVFSGGSVSLGGELAFKAGRLVGDVAVGGLANFAEGSTKLLDGCRLTVTSTEKMNVCGTLLFAKGASVTANVGVKGKGRFAMQVHDKSVGNRFVAKGLQWRQS
eukprot:Rhum_TRINITY_DN21067_c0_g1::Rhum_TRINITY_DN21067_c0_g1_i1::g.173079::m.173079